MQPIYKALNPYQRYFQKYIIRKHIFISRSDSSGTHSAEMNVWDNIGLDPTASSGSVVS